MTYKMSEVDIMKDTLSKYVDRLLPALDLEHKASLARNNYISEQNPGLQYMVIVSCTITENGSVVVKFRGTRNLENIVSLINVGDLAGVGSMTHKNCGLKRCRATGSVVDVQAKSVSVVFDDVLPFESMKNDIKFFIIKVNTQLTVRHMKSAAERLLQFGPECRHVTDLLFGAKKLLKGPLHPALLQPDQKITFLLPLNEEQAEAVEFALRQTHLAVIHGPPGTGKSTALAELIYQLTLCKEKVLVCAPSNVAVDQLMSQVITCGVKAVRLGVYDRVDPANRPYTAENYMKDSAMGEPLADARKDLQEVISKLMTVDCPWQDRRELEARVKFLRAEVQHRQRKLCRESMQYEGVCFVTLGSVHRENLLRYFAPGHFSTVIIDECSQAMDAACWMAISQGGRRCVLAGDHLQLAPLVLSPEAAKLGLNITLMERAMKRVGDTVSRTLTVQYRMHADIMEWVSNETYGGHLTAHPTVAGHLLRDLPGVVDIDVTATPLVMWDTSGCALRESTDDQTSINNVGEAEIVVYLARQLVDAGVMQEAIAVIAPYSSQVELVTCRLKASGLERVEAKTVDGFQGREKEAILLTMVRSNPEHSLGFLKDRRRLNVAASRARRLLCVVADASTVCEDQSIHNLVEHIRRHGIVNNAHELSVDVTSRCIDGPGQPEARHSRKTNKKLVEAEERFALVKIQLQHVLSGSLETLAVHAPGLQSPRDLLKLSAECDRLGLHKTMEDGYVLVTLKPPKEKSSEQVTEENWDLEDDSSAVEGNETPGVGESGEASGIQAFTEEITTAMQPLKITEREGKEIMETDQENEVHGETEAKLKKLQKKLAQLDGRGGNETPGVGESGEASGIQAFTEEIITAMQPLKITERGGKETMETDQEKEVHGGTEAKRKKLKKKLARLDGSEGRGGNKTPGDGESGEASGIQAFTEEITTAMKPLKKTELDGKETIETDHEKKIHGVTGGKCKKRKKKLTQLNGSDTSSVVLLKGLEDQEPNGNQAKTIEETGAVPPVKHSLNTRGKKKKLHLEQSASPPEQSGSKKEVKQTEDEFLNEQVKLSKRCASEKCKTSVQLIGYNCPLCMSRYCIPHTLPEVHGCEANAKKAAQKEFRHPPTKPLKPDKRQVLVKAVEKQVLAKAALRKGGAASKK